MGPDQPSTDTYVSAEAQATAAAELQREFPDITIEGKTYEKDDAFWAAYMKLGGKQITLSYLIDSLLCGVLQGKSRERVSVALHPEHAADSSMNKGIRIVVEGKNPLSSQDERPFALNQVYQIADGGGLKVHLESVVAPHRGRVFVSSDLALAKRLGVRLFTLSASSFRGSQEGVFAWARYGFVPNEKDWDDMRRWGLDKIEKSMQSYDELKKILLDPAPVALRRLVYLTWLRPKELTNFLNRVLSSNVSWKGQLDLTDKTSVEWIETYIKVAQAGKELERFTKLLPAASPKLVPPPKKD